MKKIFLDVTFATLCAALLAACGGDSGSSADSLDESSSSSEMDGAESSDSEDLNSNGSEGSEGNSSSASEGVEGSSASVSGGSSDASAYDVVTGTLTDSRDGQTYRTVKIGGQVWMAKNLNYETDKSWCYDNDPANCAKYGRLYTWAAAMDSVGEWSTNGKGCGYGKTCSVASAGSATLVRGVCPEGWHLPSHDEWEALFTAVGGSFTAGSKLKSQTGWTAYSDIPNEDAFGFSALPAGCRNGNGGYYDEGNNAIFWSSSEYDGYYAYYMLLTYDGDLANLSYNDNNLGFSVRCLKD